MTGAEVILTLPGALNACINLISVVQIGRCMGDDYARYLFRIEAAGLRLSRWGESLQLDTGHAAESLSQRFPGDVQHAIDRLNDIQKQFERVQKQSLKDKQKLSDRNVDLTAWDPDKDTDTSRGGMRTICSQMKRMTLGRRKGNFLDQTKWALYKKDTFDMLVTNIEASIGDLLDLFPAADAQDQQTALARQEAQELSRITEATPDDFEHVAAELKERDPGLSEALEEALQENGRPQAARIVNTVNIKMNTMSGIMIGQVNGNSRIRDH